MKDFRVETLVRVQLTIIRFQCKQAAFYYPDSQAF